MLKRVWRRHRAAIVVIVAVAVAWALAPQALDLPRLARRLGSARPWPLLLAFVLQVVRYLGTGLLMSLFASAMASHASPATASLVSLASGAASRLVPVAGAGGIAVRYAYLRRCGIADAAVGGYFVLQNVLGSAVLVTLFAAAGTAVGQAGAVHMRSLLPAVASLLAFAALLVWLRRRPSDARRIGGRLGCVLDSITVRFGRSWNLQQRLESGGDSLAHALSLGGAPLWRLAEAFLYASWTIVGDVGGLYAAGLALGLAPGVAETIVAYGVASFAASAVAMPAGLGVTEGAMAAMLTGYGVAADAAISQVLLFRGLSFWLPILLGLVAAWGLRRRGVL